MSTEQTPIGSSEPNIDVTTEDNLDSFAAEFFGEKTEPSDNAKSEEPEEVPEVEDDAPEKEDTHSADDGATEEPDTEEEEDSEGPEPDSEQKPKGKNRYQERINELTAKARQAERERDELLRKLEEKTPDQKPEPTKAPETTVNEAPSPTAKNEDGSDKYPLGEFDPQFLRDTVQHMLNEEQAAREQKTKEQEQLTEQEKYRNELQTSWNEKLSPVQERYPDFQEKGEQMVSVFEGIDPDYGQYLTDTLMEMDAGPEVFYYLSNNLDEAEAIVNAGPRKATLALAKIEAQLVGTQTTKAPVKKTTNAPPPPPRMKGSAVSKASISLDTDDLDAFSKVLFTKK